MKKNAKVILAVISAACIALTACSKDTADTSASETAETATSETASAVEYDLGLDDDGYFRDVTASKYIKMPKDYKKYTVSKDVYVVTDEEIQSELDYFQSNYKLTTEVTDRAAQEGDVVNIDYVDDGKQWQTRSWRLLRCRPFLERLRSGRQPPR